MTSINKNNIRLSPHEYECTGHYGVSYKVFHIPSGRTYLRTRTFPSRRHFLEALNAWNGSQPGVWVHYEVITS